MSRIPEHIRAELEEISKRVSYISVLENPSIGKWVVQVMTFKECFIGAADSLEEAVSEIRNAIIGWEKSVIPKNLKIPTWMGTNAEGCDEFLQEELVASPWWAHKQYGENYRN